MLVQFESLERMFVQRKDMTIPEVGCCVVHELILNHDSVCDLLPQGTCYKLTQRLAYPNGAWLS